MRTKEDIRAVVDWLVLRRIDGTAQQLQGVKQ
jgi:hypothetical protein